MLDAWQIDLDAEDAIVMAALARDVIWNAYGIADLEPLYRQYARFAVARRGDDVAVCFVYRHPAFTSLIPSGDSEGLTTLLAAAELPDRATMLALDEHLPAIQRHYAYVQAPAIFRKMFVTPATFQPGAGWEAIATPLGMTDIPALQALYAHYLTGSTFSPDQLAGGPFYGVWRDGRLVAAGGTHTLSRRAGIGAVGLIFTLPEARGQGYARAITSAVTAAHLALGCHTVILNVAADNAPAWRIYERLGYHEHCRFWEGPIMRRR